MSVEHRDDLGRLYVEAYSLLQTQEESYRVSKGRVVAVTLPFGIGDLRAETSNKDIEMIVHLVNRKANDNGFVVLGGEQELSVCINNMRSMLGDGTRVTEGNAKCQEKPEGSMVRLTGVFRRMRYAVLLVMGIKRVWRRNELECVMVSHDTLIRQNGEVLYECYVCGSFRNVDPNQGMCSDCDYAAIMENMTGR